MTTATSSPWTPKGTCAKKRGPNRPDWWAVEKDEARQPPAGKGKCKKTSRGKDLYYREQGSCQGFADCAGKIFDGFRELGEKAPKGIGKP